MKMTTSRDILKLLEFLQVSVKWFAFFGFFGNLPGKKLLPFVPTSIGRHTRGDQSLRLVNATSPLNLQSLYEGAGCRDLSHEQFTRTVQRNKSLGLVPKLQTGLSSWDRRRDQSWSLRQDFEAKMASSQDGTCPRDLCKDQSQGRGPSCVPTLMFWNGQRSQLSTVL